MPTEDPNSHNMLSKGTVLEGNILAPGNLRIEGSVVGYVATKAKLVVSQTASLQGDLAAQHAEIAGRVEGKLTVAGLLVLKSTAVIKGDIWANKLTFEEGAEFNGQCTMGRAPKEINLGDVKPAAATSPGAAKAAKP